MSKGKVNGEGVSGPVLVAAPLSRTKVLGIEPAKAYFRVRGTLRYCDPDSRPDNGLSEYLRARHLTAELVLSLSEALGMRLDGVIGHDFLRGFRVTIDYPNGVLKLY